MLRLGMAGIDPPICLVLGHSRVESHGILAFLGWHPSCSLDPLDWPAKSGFTHCSFVMGESLQMCERSLVVFSVTLACVSLAGCFAPREPGPPVCQPACGSGELCIEGECRPACATVSDCPDDSACVDGACRPVAGETCLATGDCQEGFWCSAGSCDRTKGLGEACTQDAGMICCPFSCPS